MAYEYEIEIPMWLEDGRWLNMNVDDEVLDELEDVYRKAKAFDEIKKLEKETRLYSIAGKEDVELGTEARKIINKYTEGK